MSLIEHLDTPNWESTLRGTFEYALEVLRTDRFRHVGSAVDDMRAWLSFGGVERVRKALRQQMESLRYSTEQQEAILSCIDRLEQEKQKELLELILRGILPSPKQRYFENFEFTEEELNDLVNRILNGERPFEEWMYAHGYSRKDVAEVYQVIDQWSIEHGILAPPPYDPNLN
ncbi:MAG: hypothetical protein GY801_11825 [bacterium]|nr:hypothetical protein [bacterium]